MPTTLAYHPYKGQFSLLLVSLFSASIFKSVEVSSNLYCPIIDPSIVLITTVFIVFLIGLIVRPAVQCAGIYKGRLEYVQHGVSGVNFFSFGFRSTRTFKLTLS